jgi:hypothetical protein
MKSLTSNGLRIGWNDGLHKIEEYHDQLSDYQLLEKDSFPQN